MVALKSGAATAARRGLCARLCACAYLCAAVAAAYQRPTGPAGLMDAVRGGPWPPPASFSAGDTLVRVSPSLAFNVVHCGAPSPCQAQRAWDVYRPIIVGGAPGGSWGDAADDAPAAPVLAQLDVSVGDSTVQPPIDGVSEGYALAVTTAADGTAAASLQASSYAGLLRGLETFSQLVVAGDASMPGLFIPHAPVDVSDKPSFAHRGVLIDTSRHFIPVAALERLVDGCLYSKLSVVHWHITDSHSFPLQVPSRPNVTAAGAFSASETYAPDDVAALVAYAAQRGVRVVPEIDTPGHARAFGLAPELASIVACADVPAGEWSTYCAEPPCGQLNPASELMYDVLTDVLKTVNSAFTDSLMHLGWDEVNEACWQSDASIQKYEKDNNLTFSGLLAEFFSKERAILSSLPQKRSPVYWEEVVAAGLPLRSGDVVEMWTNRTLLNMALKVEGVRVIIAWADAYYADCGAGNIFGADSWCDPYKTWWHMYNTDPLEGVSDPGSVRQRILGGETALWSELNDEGTLDAKMWPRAAAYGGRLWSYDQPTLSNGAAAVALSRHTARLQARGIKAAPILDEYCAMQPGACFTDAPP